MFDAPEGRTGAPLDAVSARPDFVALLYPVVTMKAPFAHADSRRNLLGATPSRGARSIGSRSKRTSRPTCRRSSSCTRAKIDRCRSRTAWCWCARCARSGVPVESHFYERGAHGFGVRAGPRRHVGVAGTLDRMAVGARLHAAQTATGADDVGARRRGAAQGRSRQRHVPQSDHGRRSSRSVDPEGRRRLLHDVLVVRRLSGPRDLALARSRQLAADRSDAVQERRLGVGAGSRQAQGPLLHLLPRHLAESIELRDLGRQHSRPVERADRSEAHAHRSGPRGRSGRQALPVPQRRRAGAAGRRRAVDDRAAEEDLRRLEVSGRLGRRDLRAGRAEDPQARRLLLHGARRGRHRRAADRPHDRRRAIEDRSKGRGRTRPTTRSCARNRRTSAGGRRATARWSRTAPASGGWSITPTRTATTRSAARRCSSRSSGPPTAGSACAGADPADADREAGRRRAVPARLCVLRRFLDAARWACSGASTPATQAIASAIATRTARWC